jgi:transposase
MSVFGALEYRSGTLTTMLAPSADADHFLAFVERVVARWTDAHLVLVLDNASYHKTPILRAWFAAHADRVTVLWLPTYSPQLNLIERVWRVAKATLACHRFWNDLAGLCTAAPTIFTGIHATFAAATSPHITFGQDLCEAA